MVSKFHACMQNRNSWQSTCFFVVRYAIASNIVVDFLSSAMQCNVCKIGKETDNHQKEMVQIIEIIKRQRQKIGAFLSFIVLYRIDLFRPILSLFRDAIASSWSSYDMQSMCHVVSTLAVTSHHVIVCNQYAQRRLLSSIVD